MNDHIEPITGSNLTNLSDDNLALEVKFYEQYSKRDDVGEEPKRILGALLVESAVRKNGFECEHLANVSCNNRQVAGHFGTKKCSKLEGKTCLLKQLELFLSM